MLNDNLVRILFAMCFNGASACVSTRKRGYSLGTPLALEKMAKNGYIPPTNGKIWENAMLRVFLRVFCGFLRFLENIF